MIRALKKSVLAGLSLVLLSLAASSACLTLPDEVRPPVLTTRVDDWRDEVIYQVLVDRFANGDINNDFRVAPGHLSRYQGGDYKGLEDNLGYLAELGVTTIWISPVVKNVDTDADMDGYHGYWAQDLTQVNPHFGDLRSLRKMVAEAHKRGMKVVLDIVTNHMGQVFFYDMNMNGKADVYISGSGLDRPWDTKDGEERSKFQRISEYDPDWDPRGVQAGQPWDPNPKLAGRSPLVFINDPSVNRVLPGPGILGTVRGYHGMGRILDYNVRDQTLRGDFPGGLKDIATEDPEVRATLVDVYARWVELVDFDGFRIDTVKHVENDFWVEFAGAVRKRLARQNKNKFLMFGEAFDGDDALLRTFTERGMLDSVFYFSQHYRVFQSIFAKAHTYDEVAGTTEQSGTKEIEGLFADREKYYSEPQEDGAGVAPKKLLVNFLDNHDVARYLFDAAGDLPSLRNALAYMYTVEGIPCLYYGTELDFAGGHDPGNREVLWTSGFPTTGDTFRHIAKLARIRQNYVALRRGDTKAILATSRVKGERNSGMFAFERAGGDAGSEYALVVLNTNARKASESVDDADAPMRSRLAEGTELVDVLDPAKPSFVVGASGSVSVSVPAQTARILVPKASVVP